VTDIAERYARVADHLTATARQLGAEDWDRPAPCEGWVARDVIRHLVEWVPPFLAEGAGAALPPGPSVDDDPLGAWTAVDDGLRALLADPATEEATFSHPRAGTHPVPAAISQFVLGDVLVHTWDLAQAAGLEVRLDPDEVHRMLEGMEPMADVLAASGQFAPRVPVADGADEQTRLIALTGRQP
jgi:uncharacterized protein (TIGR03086 family)